MLQTGFLQYYYIYMVNYGFCKTGETVGQMRKKKSLSGTLTHFVNRRQKSISVAHTACAAASGQRSHKLVIAYHIDTTVMLQRQKTLSIRAIQI